MRRVEIAERRALLGVRHRLAPEARAADLAEVATALAGLHATDPASMFLAARSRMQSPDVETIERSLYVELFLLAADGQIVRGRPLGSWASTLYRWAPMKAWLGAQPEELPTEIARAELVRAWLRAFGPGTFTDLKWWTGWTAGQLKKVLADVGPQEVQLEGGVGLLLADDGAPVTSPEPWAGLLPSLDPTVMGWFERDWYLGEHRSSLFDRNGNAGPTVWWDGRVVGGWAQRKDGEIAFRLLEDVGANALTAIEAEADRLRAWLGDRRFVPRFRTPLERELCA